MFEFIESNKKSIKIISLTFGLFYLYIFLFSPEPSTFFGILSFSLLIVAYSLSVKGFLREKILNVLVLFSIVLFVIGLGALVKDTFFFPTTNGNFEFGTLDYWEVWGDPNDCATDTLCSESWCDVKNNETCKVSAMMVYITNKTDFGKYAVRVGHDSAWRWVELGAKIDLRRNFSIPSDWNNIVLSFYMRYHSDDRNTYTNQVIIRDSNNERVLLEYRGLNPEKYNWTLYTFPLDQYRGRNITLIFRTMQSNPKWTVIESSTSSMYIDNVKITGEPLQGRNDDIIYPISS